MSSNLITAHSFWPYFCCFFVCLVWSRSTSFNYYRLYSHKCVILLSRAVFVPFWRSTCDCIKHDTHATPDEFNIQQLNRWEKHSCFVCRCKFDVQCFENTCMSASVFVDLNEIHSFTSELFDNILQYFPSLLFFPILSSTLFNSRSIFNFFCVE